MQPSYFLEILVKRQGRTSKINKGSNAWAMRRQSSWKTVTMGTFLNGQNYYAKNKARLFDTSMSK